MKKIIPIAILLIVLSTYGYYDLAKTTGFVISQKDIYETNNVPQVYFTKTSNVTNLMIELIKEADEIKCAFYDLDNVELISILKEKNASVTIEDKNALDDFHSGYSSKLMHNKFCVLDKETVFTGSTNPTNNGLNKNDNNLVIIHSKHIAQNYLEEFEELINNEFGKGNKIRYPKVILNDKIIIENLFCPEDFCQEKVLEKLENAQESIYFMTFSFTDQKIADKLIEKHDADLDVKGIMEKQRINMNYNKFKYLNQSINVVTDKNKYILHHKVFIIDQETVITGSYNPTTSGTKYNDENILIITDKDIAKEYIEEFERLI